MKRNPPAMRPSMRMYHRQRTRTRTLSTQRIIFSSSIVVMLTLGIILFINISDNKNVQAATNGDYRSKATGNWNSTSTWEKFNGTLWVAASATPTSADGAITIQNGHTMTTTAAVTVDQVVIETGGQVVTSSGAFSIVNGAGDDLVVNGTLTLATNLAQLTSSAIKIYGLVVAGAGGDNTFQSGSSLTIENGGRWRRDAGSLTATTGYWIVNNGGTFQHNRDGASLPNATWNTGATCEITGVTSSVPSNLSQSFNNLTWNCTLQTSAENLSSNLTTVNGTLTIISTGLGSIKLNSGSNTTLTVSGDFIQQGGLFEITQTGSSTMNVTGNVNITGGEFRMTDATGLSTGSGSPTLNVTGNFSISNCTFNMNQYTGTNTSLGQSAMNLSGNITIGSGAVLTETSATAGKGTITLNKNGTQTLNTTGGTISNTLNFTVTNSSNVMLASDVIIPGTLSLSSGKINTGIYELKVTNTSTTAITGYSSSNYVVGNLRRKVSANGTYDFPVGSAGNYELITVTLSSMTGFTEIVASFTNANPVEITLPLLNVSVSGTAINDMLNYGYWTLTPNSPMTGGTYGVTLNEKGHSNAAEQAASYCVLKRENVLFQWQSLGTHSNNTQSESGGVAIAARSGFTSFSQFGIGKGGGALPVELVSFSAKPEGSIVKCEWQTASEINNDFFTIERSQNGKTFTSAGTQTGAGNSNTTLNYSFSDETPMKGISYYRLKQTDFDGRFSYSKIKSVSFVKEKTDAAISISSVAPNPFRENFSVTYSVQQDADVDISLSNATGQLIHTEKQNASNGINRFDYAEGLNLPEGIYFVRISFGKDAVVKKIIKN